MANLLLKEGCVVFTGYVTTMTAKTGSKRHNFFHIVRGVTTETICISQLILFNKLTRFNSKKAFDISQYK